MAERLTLPDLVWRLHLVKAPKAGRSMNTPVPNLCPPLIQKPVPSPYPCGWSPSSAGAGHGGPLAPVVSECANANGGAVCASEHVFAPTYIVSSCPFLIVLPGHQLPKNGSNLLFPRSGIRSPTWKHCVESWTP